MCDCSDGSRSAAPSNRQGERLSATVAQSGAACAATPRILPYQARAGKGWFLERRGLHCGAETGAAGKVWRRGLTASTHTSRGQSRARGYPTKADDARGPGGKPGKQAGGRGWPRPDGRRGWDGLPAPGWAGKEDGRTNSQARPGQARPSGRAGRLARCVVAALPPSPSTRRQHAPAASTASGQLSIHSRRAVSASIASTACRA